jgi:hypothetical protein
VSDEARPDSRTLYALIPLGIANHAVLTGSRVIVALDALSMGASAFTVGVLVSLYALLPMFLSVVAGRLVDRVGARRPMLVGSVLIGIAATLPVALPGLPSLFAGRHAPGRRLHGVPARGAEHDRGDRRGDVAGAQLQPARAGLLRIELHRAADCRLRDRPLRIPRGLRDLRADPARSDHRPRARAPGAPGPSRA